MLKQETLSEFQRRIFLGLDEALGYAYPVNEFAYKGTDYASTLEEIENATYWCQVAVNRMRAAARTARKRAGGTECLKGYQKQASAQQEQAGQGSAQGANCL